MAIEFLFNRISSATSALIQAEQTCSSSPSSLSSIHPKLPPPSLPSPSVSLSLSSSSSSSSVFAPYLADVQTSDFDYGFDCHIIYHFTSLGSLQLFPVRTWYMYSARLNVDKNIVKCIVQFQKISIYSPHGRFLILHPPPPQEIPVYFHTLLLKI